MKRGKVESILLIAVLALSMQVESYSVAISDRELDQYYAKNIQQKSTDVIVWKYRVWNGKKQKRRAIRIYFLVFCKLFIYSVHCPFHAKTKS